MRTEAAPLQGAPAGPAKPLRRRGRILRAFGFLCLMAAFGVGGYLAWLLWGTGLATQRYQTEFRQEFIPRLQQVKPPPAVEPAHLPGDVLAELVIPRIDIDIFVVEGTDTVDLQKGPGHYSQTAYPWQDHGRVGIAGHRTTYLHPFWSLDKMRPGDPITLKTEYGTYKYDVRRVLVIPSAGSGWVLQQTKGPTLVLTTCNPRYSATGRLIVFADRVN